MFHTATIDRQKTHVRLRLMKRCIEMGESHDTGSMGLRRLLGRVGMDCISHHISFCIQPSIGQLSGQQASICAPLPNHKAEFGYCRDTI
jgi:hypothetical protein